MASPPSTTGGLSLQTLIASAILAITLGLGAILTWQSYQAMQRILVSATSDYAHMLGQLFDRRTRELIDPAQHLLQLLVRDPVAQSRYWDQRLARLPSLLETLSANPVLSAVYVGYETGEFLLIRPLQRGNISERFAAPANANYLVQIIRLDQEQQPHDGEWRFYDDELELVQTRFLPEYRFDPRTRPWFDVGSDPTLSRPYRFFTTLETGLTLSQRSRDGRAVVGMDIALTDLADRMQAMRLTPGTELAIIENDGTILAYPGLPEPLKFDDRTDQALHLSTLKRPALEQVQTQAPGEQPQRFSSQRADWFGIHLPLATVGGHPVALLVAIPADELLLNTRHEVLGQVLWIVAVVPLLLIVGLWAGRLVIVPLRALTQQVQAITRFDFSPHPDFHPRTREIRELHWGIQHMAHTIQNLRTLTRHLDHSGHSQEVFLCEVLRSLTAMTGLRSAAVYLTHNKRPRLRCVAQVGEQRFPDHLPDGNLPLATIPAELARQHQTSSGRYQVQPLLVSSGHSLGLLITETGDSHPKSQGAARHDEAFAEFLREVASAITAAIQHRRDATAHRAVLDAVLAQLAARHFGTDAPSLHESRAEILALSQTLLAQILVENNNIIPSAPTLPTDRVEPRALPEQALTLADRLLSELAALGQGPAARAPQSTLSQVLFRLADDVRRGELDERCFRALVVHDIYDPYATRYLKPDQRGAIDKDAILRAAQQSPSA